MKAVCLLSSGIDSPVSAFVMARAGAEVILLHMDNRPYSDDRTIKSVTLIADKLREATGQDIPLYSAPHGPIQKAVKEAGAGPYQCVVCKHAMQLVAREFAKNMGAGAIIMGDSLGQVASQTLRNIASENMSVSFPVLRPLIGYDKLEIEAIAQEIGTYEISNMPVTECTALPKHVVTEANSEKTEKLYSEADLESLTTEAASAAVRISRAFFHLCDLFTDVRRERGA